MAQAISVAIAEAMETITQSITNGRSASLSLLVGMIHLPDFCLILIDSNGLHIYGTGYVPSYRIAKPLSVAQPIAKWKFLRRSLGLLWGRVCNWEFSDAARFSWLHAFRE
jgi:hypothetical protein